MALTSGFYNSLSGDRKYDALQMSSLFDGIITDGIFESIGTSFVVRPGTGMNVIIGIGRAWFRHTWTNNDSEIIKPIDISEVVLKRIDTIVLEVNTDDAVRANSIKLIKGTPAATPVAPTLIDTTLVKQYPLADIYVGAGVTSFVIGDITKRIGTTACPYLKAVVSTLNVDAPGAAGNVLTSNGSIWQSASPNHPVGAVVGTTDIQTLTNKTLTRPTSTNAADTHQILVDAPTVAWNADLGASARISLTANRIMGTPTNLRSGGTYMLIIVHSGGGRLVTWESLGYRWSGGVAPVLSTTAEAIDMISFWSNGLQLFGGSVLRDVR